MSGIEIFIIVAGGIYIHKKVQERKQRKRLSLAGVTSDTLRTSTQQRQHGLPQLVDDENQRRNRQQVSLEEEALPAYSPPPQNQLEGTDKNALPSYDEILRDTEEQDRRDGIEVVVAEPVVRLYPTISARMAENMKLADAASSSGPKKSRSSKWKVWKKEDTKQAA